MHNSFLCIDSDRFGPILTPSGRPAGSKTVARFYRTEVLIEPSNLSHTKGPLRTARPLGANPVAHRNDGVQVVVLDATADLALALSPNY